MHDIQPYLQLFLSGSFESNDFPLFTDQITYISCITKESTLFSLHFSSSFRIAAAFLSSFPFDKHSYH